MRKLEIESLAPNLADDFHQAGLLGICVWGGALGGAVGGI